MKPSEIAKSMQAAIDLLVQQREQYLAAHPDASEPEQADEWPKVGCRAWFVGVEGDVDYVYFDNDSHDKDAMAIGNCYRTEAEARRHVEALKVQAELRRMPGRCAPPDDGGPKYCIDFDGAPIGFRVHFAGFTGAELLAVAGVWFATEKAAQHALDTIGQSRLRLWLDDYLQTPMEGGAE